MLVIFDLDDTLVDTSGCITYYKLADAIEAMLAAGLKLGNITDGLDLLRRLNERAVSARVALTEFVEILGADRELIEVGARAVYATPLPSFPLHPLSGALDVLTSLRIRHRLALVTIGDPELQMAKLKKAGIDTALFSKILVTPEEDKQPLYKQLIRELRVPCNEVLVCGDRILRDLSPGKALGFKTVLMKWGRGLSAVLPHGDVDYAISSLVELASIVEKQMSFASSIKNNSVDCSNNR